jgi:hypothetical protein
MRNFGIDSLHCFSNEEFEKMAADASELAKRRVYGGVGQYFPGGSYLTAEEVAKKINLGRRGDTPTTICTWDGFWKGAMPSPYRTIREFLRGWKTVDEDHRTEQSELSSTTERMRSSSSLPTSKVVRHLFMSNFWT